jgi:23S rRNA (cytosine1962-C5)-methyltransferase
VREQKHSRKGLSERDWRENETHRQQPMTAYPDEDVSLPEQIKVLNLFGYTGGASLACAQAGASVVHVDGSKTSIKRAKENAELSNLVDKPIRWLLDDAREFVKRELRRGNKYDCIIMDPPSFGRGDKGQVWKIEEDFVPLFNDCIKLLSDKPLLFIINGYAAGYSSIAYANNLEILKNKFGGVIEAGELTLEENEGRGPNGGNGPQARLLPCGIFARWSK